MTDDEHWAFWNEKKRQVTAVWAEQQTARAIANEVQRQLLTAKKAAIAAMEAELLASGGELPEWPTARAVTNEIKRQLRAQKKAASAATEALPQADKKAANAVTAEALPVRRAYLTRAGGAWRSLEWDGLAWREPAAAQSPMDCPDGRAWLRLRCADEGARATKLWTLAADGWSKVPEAPGFLFVPETVWVEDTAEAWAECFRSWENDAGAFLVRGVVASGSSFGGGLIRGPRAELVRRAKVADKGAWLGPHPVGRRVIVLDFDGLDVAALGWLDWPGAVRWPTADEGAALVRRTLQRTLPGRFWGAAAAYRWSASTGVPGGKRGPTGWASPSCHVALVLDRSVCDMALQAWLRAAVPRADASVAEAVKPLFLASPMFDGASPWPADFNRVGLLEGHATTEAPAELLDGWAWQTAKDGERAAEVAALAVAIASEAGRRRYGEARAAWGDGTWAEREEQSEEERRRRFGDATLARAADAVAGAAEGTRHATMLARANQLGRFVGGGLLDEARVIAALTRAWAQAAGGREDGARALADGLRDGKASPRTWAEVRDDKGFGNGR